MSGADCRLMPSGFLAVIARTAVAAFWAVAFIAALSIALPDLAQAQTSAIVGQVETLTGSASAVRTNGNVDALQVGTRIFNGDTVQTANNSRLGITFLDQTVFSLSANAKMVIDDLVYSPSGNSNKMLVNLAQGTFVFLAGKIASTGDMKVGTRVATIGIRGTQPWITVSPAITSFTIMSERDGKTGEYFLFRKGTNTVIATVNLATVGTTRKYIMGSPSDDPILVDKTPAELRREPQLKNNLFASLQVRDARLGNEQIKKPDGPAKNNRSQAPDQAPRPPTRMVDNGLMFGGIQPYFEIGGGLNFSDDNRELGKSGQSISGKLGAAGFGEAGIKWNNVFGNVGVSVGVVGQFQNWNNKNLRGTQTTNDSSSNNNIPLNGTTQAFSIFPRVTLSGPLSEYTSWRAGVGGGVAFQKLDATDSNRSPLKGSKATPIVNLNGGLGYMLLPGVDVWLNGYATWLEGYDVETGTSTTSRYDSQWNAGATLSLRFSLQPPSPR